MRRNIRAPKMVMKTREPPARARNPHWQGLPLVAGRFVLLCVLTGLMMYVGFIAWEGADVLERMTRSKTDSSSSVDFEGLNFANTDALRVFLRTREQRLWVAWIFHFPLSTVPLVAAVSFGVLGGYLGGRSASGKESRMTNCRYRTLQ